MANTPQIDYDFVDTFKAKGCDIPFELKSRTENYVPPVDIEFWIAVLWEDVAFAAKDPGALEVIVDEYLDHDFVNSIEE